jgi:hypothetical protein
MMEFSSNRGAPEFFYAFQPPSIEQTFGIAHHFALRGDERELIMHPEVVRRV